MNLKQLAYQYGRLKNNNPHIICPAITAASIACLSDAGIDLMENSSAGNFISIPVFAYFSLCFGKLSVLSIKSKKRLNQLKKDEDLLSENIGNVFLDDKQGLEMLLEKTAKSKRREWGTVLKAYKEKKMAVIYKILAPDSAKDAGMVKSFFRQTRFEEEIMKEKGYNGTHHFHTNTFPKRLGSMHFAINMVDRSAEAYLDNSVIHLLTFNLPEGPEVIGYDSQYTYIPSDKSKRELVRATPKQIMEYLG